jgi:hypothetical protein
MNEQTDSHLRSWQPGRQGRYGQATERDPMLAGVPPADYVFRKAVG